MLPSLAETVAVLSRPDTYPGAVRRVQPIETHWSWVFLAGDFAYKLKKPVLAHHVDMRSLESRHFYCMEELRLNRRLARHVYLDLTPLSYDRQARLVLGGSDAAIEWLVRMRRLPRWLLLDVAIASASAGPSEAVRIAAALARFHAALPREEFTPSSYVDRFRQQIQADCLEFRDPALGLLPHQTEALCEHQKAALACLSELIGKRATAGALVEGHGDLRPEHVCLCRAIAIIDCLEFSRALRVMDRADEVGFLALECERLGAPQLGMAITDAYRAASGDDAAPSLVHFYQSCRARKRALLAVRHLKEDKYRQSGHWRQMASHYLALAWRHVQACSAH